MRDQTGRPPDSRLRASSSVPPAVGTDDWPYVLQLLTPPAYKIPAGLDLASHRGVSYVEVFVGRSGEPGRILIVWRNREACNLGTDDLVPKMELENAFVTFEGARKALLEPEKSWCKRTVTVKNLWAALGIGFIILGYLSQAHDASGWLGGSPRVEPTSVPVELDLLRGRKATVHVKVRNVRSIGNCEVTYGRPVSSEPSVATIVNTPKRSKTVPALVPNGEADLEVTILAQKQGSSKLSCDGKAKAGWPNSMEASFKVEMPIRVWSALDIQRFGDVLLTEGNTRCTVPFQLRCGSTLLHGLHIEFVLPDAEVAEFHDLSLNTDQHIHNPRPNASKPTAKAEMQTIPLDAFTTYRIPIVLRSRNKKALTPAGWRELANKLDVRPYHREY